MGAEDAEQREVVCSRAASARRRSCSGCNLPLRMGPYGWLFGRSVTRAPADAAQRTLSKRPWRLARIDPRPGQMARGNIAGFGRRGVGAVGNHSPSPARRAVVAPFVLSPDSSPPKLTALAFNFDRGCLHATALAACSMQSAPHQARRTMLGCRPELALKAVTKLPAASTNASD